MQSRVNIFHNLQHDSDVEEENNTQDNKAKKITEKREQRAQNKANTGPKNAEPVKEEHTKAKGPQKQKGVTAEPHPLDRHSGHGNQAFGGKPKKSGAGKGNWGNFKEDRKGNDEAPVEGAEEGAGEQKPQEEEPVGITLAEYYQNRGQAQNTPQVNEAKAKITSEQLTKELGNATALKTKGQQQIDDKKVGKKKERVDVDHHAAINSEHANLLSFRTGFVEKDFKPRGERTGEEAAGQRRAGPRTGQKERENAKEEEGQAQPAEGQTAEGQQAVEGQTTQEGQGQAEGTSPTQGRGGRGGRGGKMGYRGERPQDRQQGDRQQGDRPQGDRPRKQYGNKETKVNIEDESAFPKLG